MWAAVAYKVQCAELNSRTLCLEEGSGNEIATVAEPWTQDGASSGQANASLVEQLFQSCRVDTLAASAELGLRVSLRRLIFLVDLSEGFGLAEPRVGNECGQGCARDEPLLALKRMTIRGSRRLPRPHSGVLYMTARRR